MIVTDQKQGLASMCVYGEFTMADIREFEDLVNSKIQFEGPVNLLVDLRQMADFTLDVALEEVKFSRIHAGDFGSIAVLTDSQWVSLSAWLAGIFAEADVKVFQQEGEALAWLAEA